MRQGGSVVLGEAVAGAAVELPAPDARGRMPLEATLDRRRSLRDFSGAALALADLGQLLWAAQGTTSGEGHRTAPSAGALYPLEVYVVAGRVEGLAAGCWRYETRAHRLVGIAEGDRRRPLAAAALGQDWLARAPAVIVLAGVEERTAFKYGDRAPRYVHIEAGAAAQNVALQAEARGLGTVVVGAFDDARVAELAGLRTGERPLALLPVGRR